MQFLDEYLIDPEELERYVKMTNHRLNDGVKFPNVYMMGTDEDCDYPLEFHTPQEEKTDLMSLLAGDNACCPSCGMILECNEDINTSEEICVNCGVLVSGPKSFIDYNNSGSNYTGPSDSLLPTITQAVCTAPGVRTGKNHREQSLQRVFNRMAEFCENTDITPLIVSTAQTYYAIIITRCVRPKGPSAGKKIILRDRVCESIMAACVYVACRKERCPHTIKEIAAIFKINKKKLTKACSNMVAFIRTDNAYYEVKPRNLQSEDIACDFIIRMCGPHFFNYEGDKFTQVVDLCQQMIHNCFKLETGVCHIPQAIAAGSLCLASDILDLELDHRVISEYLTTSLATVVKVYREMEPVKDIITDDELSSYTAWKISQMPQKKLN